MLLNFLREITRVQGDSGPVLLVPSALCGTAEPSALHAVLLAVSELTSQLQTVLFFYFR